jgi:hypothetical protein
MAATYEPIASITLGAAAASVIFNNILQTYTDLVLVAAYDLASGGGSMAMRFNSDSAGNYGVTYLFGNGSAAGSGRVTNSTSVAAGRAAPGGQGGGHTYIMNYSNATTYKSALSRSYGTIAPASPWLSANTWRNTNAITSITCTDESSGNFAVGATFNLYGIKAGS